MKAFVYILVSCMTFFACAHSTDTQTQTSGIKQSGTSSAKPKGNAVAYFASGCFWCVEAVFESVKGVSEVESGFAGGSEETATYRQVSSGTTQHAESVKIYYDSTVVSYETLLKVFFASQDPTTPNRQGPDIGTQYRSVIFYTNAREKKLAEDYIAQLLAEKQFPRITTQVVPFSGFYLAEDYHQNYVKNHPNDGYVQSVSIPRIREFQDKHPELLK